MNHHYRDITSRINEEPKWYDENAVPRYCDFAPNEVADIYAKEAVLMLIACQSCGQPFKVAMSLRLGNVKLARRIEVGEIYYGDPPNACGKSGKTCSGATMSCLDLRVLEYWRKVDLEWQRDSTLEISLPDESEEL